jgi:hypothetical protein
MMKKNPFLGYGARDTSKFHDIAAAAKAKKLTMTEHVTAERAERERQARARDYAETVDVVTRAVQPIDPASLAAAVIRAGQRRRGEVPTEDQMTDLSPNAADSPAVANAKLILLAGMRRRGEIK